MGIRESLLNTITSVGSSDFVRIVTSAGASSKATLQNVIKSFETGLGSKSSLTTSDYIRVVGSDNNLYKQSVSSVQSAWGIDKLTGGLASPFSGDANTLTSTGQWQVGNPANVTNLPSGVNYGIIAVETAREYVYQRYIELAILVVYYRRSVDSGTNWSAWTEQPTRTEIDTLINKKNYCINLGSTGSSDKTVSSADWTTILSVSNVQLNAGTYMFISTINAKWTNSSYQFYPGVRIGSTDASSLTDYAAVQDGSVTAIGYINVPTTGNYTVSLIGRVTDAQKIITIPAYQSSGVSLIRMN